MNEKIAADRMTDIIFKINKLEVEKASVTKRFNNEISALEKELQGVALEYKNPQPDLFHDAELGKVLFEAIKTKDILQITTIIRQFEDHTMLIVVINPDDEEPKQFEQRFEKSYEAFEWLIFLNEQVAAFDPDKSIVENEMFKALDFILAAAEHLIDEYRSLKELRRVYCESLIQNGYNPNDLEGDLYEHQTRMEDRLEQIESNTDPNMIIDPTIAVEIKRWIAAIKYRLDNPEEPEQSDSDIVLPLPNGAAFIIPNQKPDMTIPDAVDVEDINF